MDRELIKSIVDRQFRHVNTLKQEAYDASLEMITDEIYEGIEKGLEDHRQGKVKPWEDVKSELNL